MALGSDQATGLLVQLYVAILGRPPDAEALARIVPQLVAGADPAVIRSQLATGSLEATLLIDGFYADLLGRGADLPSFTQYLAGLSNGAFTLAALRAQFAAGSEAASAIGQQYVNVLGRHADATGLIYFQSALGAGGTLSQIRQALATSPEEASSLAALYGQVLGRAATAPEVAADTAALGQGRNGFFDILHGLAFSAEAAVNVAALYRSLLGRAPTAAESYNAGLGFENHGSLASLQSTLAGSPETLTRLSTQYELVFGAAPAPGTLALQVAELKLGRPFIDVVQVTANFVTRQDAFFIYNYGYAIPAQYSTTGSRQFVPIYQNTSPLQIGAAFTTIPIPTSGAAAPGPDTITVNLRTVGAPPVSFTATLDGRAVGGATVTAGPPGSPFAVASQDQVTFTGDFGAGLHDLHIQVTGDPAANALVIPGTATFDANQFLLGPVTTGATGAADIFPHAGPRPAIIYGPTS